ncbi:MAG: hypothetical protein ACXAC7_07815 [Candidatus Hodarchaeales archaeon]|jgi:hypothetical protein
MSSETTEFELNESILKILDISLLTYLALIFLGLGYYATILTTNVQNVLPILLVGGLTIFTWATRTRLNKLTVSETRPLFIQWGLISAIIIIFVITVILIYPISN